MANLNEQAAVAASLPPQLGSITFGLDTNQFAPSLLVLEVSNVNANDSVHISRGLGTTWDGVLKKSIDTNLWLAEVKYTGQVISTGPVIFSLETLTVTVTSGGVASNPAQVDTNIYDST